MELISVKYAIITVISIFVFYLLKDRYRIVFLNMISCFFLASFSYVLLIYVILYSLINYFLGEYICNSRYKLLTFRIGIIFNLSQLILLKYSSFAIDPILQVFDSKVIISDLSRIIMPLGISYFTLQGIGYLINVKMGWEKNERNFFSFLLYIVFFPKFLSGPIERSNHFLPQLKSAKLFNATQVSEGLRIALFGFFKKIAIANQIAPFLNNVYSNTSAYDGSSHLALLILQPLYLYFDFSGYTDIAIGFSKAFGIEILPNFNRPFFSENMTTFWKRFHISLSSWFNDYVFRQTSFKYRKYGIYASVFAAYITFQLFGIWHGAGWNFMILGLLQATAIIYEFLTKKWRIRVFSGMYVNLRIWFGRIVTYLFYGGSLVFFFSPDLNSSLNFFSKILSPRSSFLEIIMREIPLSAIIFIIGFFLIELLKNDYTKTYNKLASIWTAENKKNMLFRWTVYYLMLAVIFVLGNNAQQFIYAQF